jgi:hypothetical protein
MKDFNVGIGDAERPVVHLRPAQYSKPPPEKYLCRAYLTDIRAITLKLTGSSKQVLINAEVMVNSGHWVVPQSSWEL